MDNFWIQSYAKPEKANAMMVHLDNITIWMSYDAVIAFRVFGDDGGFFIRQNDWNNTTGRHLNLIDSDKSKRLPSAAFEAAFASYDVKLVKVS